ncbi:MAG: metal-binding protein [Thermoplasmatales archaeon]|nr:metal-binding protein [Thermoplasmatales archaeon]MCW6169731.1 metal-binding protein [Thermoplasmatales archaeon]
MSFIDVISEFDNITISNISYGKNTLSGIVTLTRNGEDIPFNLKFRYSDDVSLNENLGGLIITMPAINFTLFAKKLTLDYPVSDNDMEAIKKFVRINNRDVFINKLVRRRYEFFKSNYIPTDSDITSSNIDGITEVVRTDSFMDTHAPETIENNVAILSSGGKESLLSYGMLSEIGANTFEIFFNESGAHWMTAKTAYDDFTAKKRNVERIWSNVDRFYRFCLRNMQSINQNVIQRKTDTYPVQLFIFPVYVMSSLPIIEKNKISGIVIGDEFDDPREMGDFKGFKHYYGIFDQSIDFNRIMSSYLNHKGFQTSVWSAVYPITASVVENILVNRYPDLFRLQRSCHSCRKVEGLIRPCGNCSKCMGVMLFVKAAGGNLSTIGYDNLNNEELLSKVSKERMRLDPDELILLEERLGKEPTDNKDRTHIESIHILPEESESFSFVPENFRDSIRKIIFSYTNGEYSLRNNEWIKNKPLQ